MKPFKINKIWALTSGVVALTAAIALFAPVKSASAAYSSPVTVLNTNTGPVPVVAQDALQSSVQALTWVHPAASASILLLPFQAVSGLYWSTFPCKARPM
jgi:hypothetical protein